MARRKKTPANVAPPAEAVSGPPPDRPVPSLVAALILAATVTGCGYFVWQGFEGAGHGKTRLAGELLEIAPRDHTPYTFELPDLSGAKVSLDQLEGKVVLINFWATWCPPCVEEMPSMVRLYEKMKGDPRFVMLAISTDESWEPVNKFFEGSNPGFTVLLDPKGGLAKKYGTTMFPETYVVVGGKVRAFIEGPRHWDTWYAEEYLRGLLEGS